MFKSLSFVLVCVQLFTIEVGSLAASCPDPCRCLKFEGLWSVYCNVSGITEVPKGIPSNTQLLDLSQNSISKIRREDFKGLPNLQELDLSANGLKEQSIDDGALDLPSLQIIDLTQNGYSTIPTALPKNLTKLYILYNRISNLTIFSFKNCQLLQYIDITNNHLHTFEPGTFDWLQDLSTLYMQFNSLTDKSFPPNLFSKNRKLELLGLRFNKLTRLVQGLPSSIQYLDYVGNRITTLPSFAFRDLPNLQSMEFWEGQVLYKLYILGLILSTNKLIVEFLRALFVCPLFLGSFHPTSILFIFLYAR